MLKNYLYLDLREHFNLKLVNNSICFAEDRFPEFGKPLCFGKAFYVFSRNNDNSDCLYCNEQIIETGCIKASALFMLAIMDWGDTEESVEVIYDDGTRQRLSFYLWDSGNFRERFDYDRQLKNAAIAFQCENIHGSKSAIYEIELELNPEKAVSSIVMPYNTNLSVFAISLQTA